jgi:hypothetical protein
MAAKTSHLPVAWKGAKYRKMIVNERSIPVDAQIMHLSD